ncbi:MAG: class I SAM-dependent methyltransferase, partial [Ilumatobacteraceae bacterium]
VASALATAGHVSGLPTPWVWEGVVPYLTLTQVDATMRAIARASAPGSTLVVNYQSRRWRARIGRLLARAMALVARADDPMAGEPFRSSWTTGSMAALLGRHGFAVESDRDLETIATAMGAHLGSRHSLRSGRVAIARTGQPS